MPASAGESKDLPMAGVPYCYFVEYRQEIDQALQELKRREFEAGRYFPVVVFPFQAGSITPGPRHRSIDEARRAASETGTRSILDIDSVGPDPAFATANPVDGDELQQLYGTREPTRDAIERWRSAGRCTRLRATTRWP